jgi:SAM-dependent methyltransferase
MNPDPSCRFCHTPLTHVMCDLGSSPLANSYPTPEDANRGEHHYPLKALVCSECLLVQLESYETPEAIFSDYPYFSSISSSWLDHARRYCEMMARRFGFDGDSQIVEIASNDGYLLRNFQEAGMHVLGIEPAANVAREAWRNYRIPSLIRFFNVETAQEIVARGRSADLIVGNNVLAHVPDINGFVAGIRIALKPDGVATFEFPHLMKLIDGNQFDTIYHEHFSYFSLLAVERIFARHGLTVFDVEEIPTHGGSLRIFVAHEESADGMRTPTGRVEALKARENSFGLERPETYEAFSERVNATKRSILGFLIEARESGRSVVAYGAAAKGVTLLNFCGAGNDLIDYAVDKSPHKQNRLVPGTGLSIHEPARIFETQPDYLLILPWNLSDEIRIEMAGIREWNGRFVVPIPTATVLD